MSAARTARRVRIKLKSGRRYNRPTRRDATAKDRDNRAKWEAEKLRAIRKGQKK